MAKIKLKHGAPQLRFIRAEVVAGAFDAPQNQAQAEAEAAKFTPGPGGIFTFSNIRQVVRRSRRYEREAIEYRERALQNVS
ncbi:MAG: hypothetical protein ACLP2Y_11865 [Limisphaerales bacterium]